jgi:hypothetical protein
LWTQIQATQAKIQSGQLKVPLTTKAGQVKALINKK